MYIRSLLFALAMVTWTTTGHAQELDVNDLLNPDNLLANCTIENDGSLAFGTAKTEMEKLLAKHAYLMAQTRCTTFIYGVTAGTINSGKARFCLPDVSLGDLRAAVLLTLKQKYKTAKTSVPIILEALEKNWPCS